MTTPGHPQDDRLLELAYGEVEGSAAQALRRHVEGCPRCRDVLQGIAEVRRAVRRVPPEAAPEQGLESLLAYGEQAAARARVHRRNVRLLGLLTLATAAGLAFVLLPDRSAPGRDAAVAVARRDAPAPPAARGGVPAPESKAKDVEVAKRDAVSLPAAKQRRSEADDGRATSAVADEARRANAVAAAAPPMDVLEKAPREQQASKKAEVASKEAGASAGLRNQSVAGPAKVVPGPPPVPATSAPLDAAAPAPLAAPGESATPAAPAGSVAAQAPAGPAAFGVAGAAGKGSARAASEAESTSLAGGTAVASAPAETVADKSVGALGQPGAASTDAKAADANATRAKAAEAKLVGSKAGADRASRERRLAEVRGSVASASGDARRRLLLEQCRLEAALELRASAVGTCSQLAREFPGTPEAQQAVELARGLSVQPPPP